MKTAHHFACIDIGGTAIKYGIADASGTLLSSFETPTLAHEGGKALSLHVKDLAGKLIEEDPSICGIAISSAGVVDSEKAEIIHAGPGIPEYAGINYKTLLEPVFHLPVEMENDVNCAGLCESRTGAGKGAHSMLMLTIGTGIGGCFIQDGRLLNGHRFSACEVGYLPMEGDEWQNLASATALCAHMAGLKNEDSARWNGKAIFEAADQGDADAIAAIEALCERLGHGLGTLSFILNPEVIILGGGIMARHETMGPKIQDSFARHTLPLIAKSTKIVPAASGNSAGMKGALIHFLRRHPELNDAPDAF